MVSHRAQLLVDLQSENGGTRRIVDAGDALEPALLGRDELQVRLGARAERTGVDMDIGDALPIAHEGPGEAMHMLQNARDGLVVGPWGGTDRHVCWGRAAWASAPVSSLARLVMARAGGHPPQDDYLMPISARRHRRALQVQCKTCSTVH